MTHLAVHEGWVTGDKFYNRHARCQSVGVQAGKSAEHVRHGHGEGPAMAAMAASNVAICWSHSRIKKLILFMCGILKRLVTVRASTQFPNLQRVYTVYTSTKFYKFEMKQ